VELRRGLRLQPVFDDVLVGIEFLTQTPNHFLSLREEDCHVRIVIPRNQGAVTPKSEKGAFHRPIAKRVLVEDIADVEHEFGQAVDAKLVGLAGERSGPGAVESNDFGNARAQAIDSEIFGKDEQKRNEQACDNE